jgi:GNAT superfamily N-acetyltransferase
MSFRCEREMMTHVDDRVNTVIIRVPTENQIQEITGLYRAQGWWQAGEDLTVRSDYRNGGIGRRILQALLERLHADGLHWIGLISEPGSYGLYRWAGFQEMSDCIPMLMNQTP